jgi:DNA repair exonuclease SbcCD ATPase subunit
MNDIMAGRADRIAANDREIERLKIILDEKIAHMLTVNAALVAAEALRAEIDRLSALNAELVAALENAEGHLEEMRKDAKWHPIGDCPVLNKVRAALAKAKGVGP